MAINLIVLAHILYISFGFIGLFYHSKRIDIYTPETKKCYILGYSLFITALILNVIRDFLYAFLWKDVSKLDLASFGAVILWCISFGVLIYWYLNFPRKSRIKRIITYEVPRNILVFAYYYFASTFNLNRIFFNIFFFIISCATFLCPLFYAFYLYTKSIHIEKIRIKYFLILSSLTVIILFSNNILFLSKLYPFPFFSNISGIYFLNALDFLLASFGVFSMYKYLLLPKVGSEQLNLTNLSEDELLAKFQISKRELEVIHLICLGKSNQEIADILFISVGTVKSHLYSIYAKVNVKNRMQLSVMFKNIF